MTSTTSTPGGAPVAGEAHVVLDRVAMAYGEREVFRDLSCSFPRGKISVVLGGSGSVDPAPTLLPGYETDP